MLSYTWLVVLAETYNTHRSIYYSNDVNEYPAISLANAFGFATSKNRIDSRKSKTMTSRCIFDVNKQRDITMPANKMDKKTVLDVRIGITSLKF